MFLSNKPLDLYYIVIEDISNCIDFNIERLRGYLSLSVSDSEFILFQSLQSILRKLYKKRSLKQLIDIDSNEEAIKTFIHQL